MMPPCDAFDRPREACGVVGLRTRENRDDPTAKLAFFSLYALQHRGQESAGIATHDGQLVRLHRGMGLVSQVFSESDLQPMTGHLAVGHVRYSTTGDSALVNAQPTHVQTLHGPLLVAHNGNLTNASALRQLLMARGTGMVGTSDTEVITQFLSTPPEGSTLSRPCWEERLIALSQRAEGAYSLVVLAGTDLYAMRDPLGLRPLCLGRLRDAEGHDIGWIAASESSALLTVGATFEREVGPGEIVRLDREGPVVVQGPMVSDAQAALCVFEYVYFARPDSVLEGQSVQRARRRMGQQLAAEAAADADLVFGVPDSSLPTAMAYAEALGLPYREGLIKNRYIQRTFIQPSPDMRKNQVRLKFNALRDNLEGKRVVMVDDSIVRGTTMGPLVRLVREAGGAREVHVRIAAPPIRHPCFMGVDLSDYEQLIAHRMDVEGIRRHVGADSLAFLSVEGLHSAVNTRETHAVACGHCDACFTGNYPIPLREQAAIPGTFRAAGA